MTSAIDDQPKPDAPTTTIVDSAGATDAGTNMAEGPASLAGEKRKRQRTTPREKPEPLHPDEVRLLWDEFKLVQDKIDRIGDFHFRVRTWAITLSTAIAIAGLTNKASWYVYLVSFPLIASFNLIDRAQTHWQEALVERARQVENHLRKHGQAGPRVAQVIRQREMAVSETFGGRLVLSNGRVFYGTMYALAALASGGTFLWKYWDDIKPWIGL